MTYPSLPYPALPSPAQNSPTILYLPFGAWRCYSPLNNTAVLFYAAFPNHTLAPCPNAAGMASEDDVGLHVRNVSEAMLKLQ